MVRLKSAIQTRVAAGTIARLVQRLIAIREGSTRVFDVNIACITSQALQNTIVASAESRCSLCVTYLNAWTLVQARRNPEFGQLLRQFDLCYSDGMGAVLAALAVNFRLLHKVTANDFCLPLCRELSFRSLSVAFIGGTAGTAEETARRLRAQVGNLDVSFCCSGFLSNDELESVCDLMCKTRPHLVFFALGQPRQEKLALDLRAAGVNTVLLCVGGLFDYIVGRNSTPPLLIRRGGFEWLWRLAGSPRRLWRRYVLGLPMLLAFIVLEHIGRMARQGRAFGRGTLHALKRARGLLKF